MALSIRTKKSAVIAAKSSKKTPAKNAAPLLRLIHPSRSLNSFNSHLPKEPDFAFFRRLVDLVAGPQGHDDPHGTQDDDENVVKHQCDSTPDLPENWEAAAALAFGLRDRLTALSFSGTVEVVCAAFMSVSKLTEAVTARLRSPMLSGRSLDFASVIAMRIAFLI